jgi:hypothetical protein
MKSTFVKSMLLTAAFALSSFAGTVTINIPFEFTASGKTLPAGEYTLTKGSSGVLVMTGAMPNSSVLILTRGGEKENTDRPAVTFNGKALSTITMGDGEKLELVGHTK